MFFLLLTVNANLKRLEFHTVLNHIIASIVLKNFEGFFENGPTLFTKRLRRGQITHRKSIENW